MDSYADLVLVAGCISTWNNLNRIYVVSSENEDELQELCESIKRILTTKKYLDANGRIDKTYYKNLRDITSFFVCNTNYRNPEELNLELTNQSLLQTTPKFSKCVLIVLIAKLNLVNPFIDIFNDLSMKLCYELVEECAKNFKSLAIKEVLYNSYKVLKAVIYKLAQIKSDALPEISEIGVQLTKGAQEILKYVVMISPNKLEGWSKLEFHKHHGYTIYKVSKLLLLVDFDLPAHEILVDTFISRLYELNEAVTLHSYLCWAEFEHKGVPFQQALGEKVYAVVEKCLAHSGISSKARTKVLITGLTQIAKKPKTIREIIEMSSDIEKVAKVDEADANQKEWFLSLFRTRIFANENIVQCIDRHYELCTVNEVDELFTQIEKVSNVEHKKLAMKCAANLSFDKFTKLIMQYCTHWKVGVFLYQNVPHEVINCLNKLNHSKETNLSLHEMEEAEIKGLLLLFLQDPKLFVASVFEESIKNPVYTRWLKDIFSVIRFALESNFMALTVLEEYLADKGIAEETWLGFATLCQVLIQVECINKNVLFNRILQTQLETTFADDDRNKVLYVLLIIKKIGVNDQNNLIRTDLAKVLINVLEKYRFKFNDFSMRRMQICTNAVEILITTSYYIEEGLIIALPLQPINKYYASVSNGSLLSYLYSEFSLDNHSAGMEKLLKILQKCVPYEWNRILMDVEYRYGSNKTIETITDCLILLCEVTKTQSFSDNDALSYYCENYTLTLQSFKAKENNLQFESHLIRMACKLLCHIPEPILKNEGMKLITLFNTEALADLAQEEEFVLSLAEIEDTDLRKVIAQKALEQVNNQFE